jgi:hypothetical protein
MGRKKNPTVAFMFLMRKWDAATRSQSSSPYSQLLAFRKKCNSFVNTPKFACER